jgi:hypothetical protein
MMIEKKKISVYFIARGKMSVGNGLPVSDAIESCKAFLDNAN